MFRPGDRWEDTFTENFNNTDYMYMKEKTRRRSSLFPSSSVFGVLDCLGS